MSKAKKNDAPAAVRHLAAARGAAAFCGGEGPCTRFHKLITCEACKAEADARDASPEALQARVADELRSIERAEELAGIRERTRPEGTE